MYYIAWLTVADSMCYMHKSLRHVSSCAVGIGYRDKLYNLRRCHSSGGE